ncbi:MAG: Rrf2 family transcriptional regulator [Phycisphaerales bacterium]|jgi:Rrf2 family nitric oxide-sensitive transcriptional repressor|nr:Rrf2 family transcriptional regulator [Phycisphaerales bacterium]
MFSQTVEYALRAIVFLAASDSGPVSSEKIASITQVPAGYVSKVMRDLVVAGLAASQRGPNGGFSLARPADKISILDVMNAVDPIRRINACPLGNPMHTKLCPLHSRLDKAIEQIESSFRETSIADLFVGMNGKDRCSALFMMPVISATSREQTG